MATLNDRTHEITCKIVYYGTGLGGKTTNLQYIHGQLIPSMRGELISLNTHSDRTLFFDYLPVELGQIKGWTIRFTIYTVPGQVEYNTTRKLVLSGADAVVFVADSDANRQLENIEALQNMFENLRELRINAKELPWLLQYNKRDLTTAMPLEKLEQQLNIKGVPSYQSVAREGLGVIACLKGISALLMQKLGEELG
jgi:hypothetical protein